MNQKRKINDLESQLKELRIKNKKSVENHEKYQQKIEQEKILLETKAQNLNQLIAEKQQRNQ